MFVTGGKDPVGGEDSRLGNGGLEPLLVDTTGNPPAVPLRIFNLNPSSSTANSVNSERFIRSMICLICFKSKGGAS